MTVMVLMMVKKKKMEQTLKILILMEMVLMMQKKKNMEQTLTI